MKLKKISSKKHFLMVLVQIWDHFLILMWKNYILKSGLRFWFPLPEVPFLAYPKLSIISVLMHLKKKWTKPETGLLSMKIQIWDHYTIDTFATLLLLSGLRFALQTSQSVSVNENKIWDHFTIDTFATLLLLTGLRFALQTSQSVFFRIFCVCSIPH